LKQLLGFYLGRYFVNSFIDTGKGNRRATKGLDMRFWTRMKDSGF
jgi:hypothetical protein